MIASNMVETTKRPELSTERLLLRQWRATDFPIYEMYYSYIRTAQFVGGVMTPDRAWRHMAALIGHWELMGFGYWAVEELQGGAFVGCVGLWKSAGWPELELGYWLTEESNGKGYATEAGRACLNYAYDVLGVHTLVSYIDPSNEPSKKVALRLSATFEKEIELLEHGPHCVYRHSQKRASP